ncbi:helicase C-terminal domain-containing protein [Anaerotardibacter muris]|uniref:helicase C-terminal domain-containing protein n=1 Tax=Anaerotardibacter muris TaxID=2941505 RepID=UPI00203DC26D|nr:helicase C-terminal domain-containing protein [Anaerotardibacter muris]
MEKQNKTAESRLKTYILENTPDRIVERYASLKEYAEANQFGALDEDVVVLDTETTGFSFNHDELIQIAAARMRFGEIVEWYVTFVNPGKEIPDEVAYLTNIHAEDVADAPDPDTALAGLVDFVGDSLVVAHNVGFDRTFVTKRKAGEALKDNIWIDSLDLARIALPRLNSHRLLDLVRAFGGADSTHRADDDVAATCLVYRILLAAVAKMPESLVKHIANMADVERWNTVYAFKELANPDAPDYSLARSRRADVALLQPENSTQRPTLASSHDEPLECFTENIAEQEEEGGRPLKFVSDEELANAFEPGGILGGLYEDYEPREPQKLMALSIQHALRTGQNAAIEAGTGVGKSMAYLLPLALLARENGVTTGVATKTNTLLDQLINKELPLLKEALGVTFASLKGFTHYPCLRKIEQVNARGPQEILVNNQMVDQAPALATLLSFIEQTDYDDLDGLKLNFRALPRYRIASTSTECLRRKCPFFGKTCFVHGARDRAQHCDIVITNHSLLFWDARFEHGLLPPIRYWVVDEAHNAEEEARHAFSTGLSSDFVKSIIRRLTSDSARYNPLIRAERVEVGQEAHTLLSSLLSKARNAGVAFAIAAEEYCLSVKDLLYFDTRKKNQSYEYLDLWLNDEIRASSVYQGVVGCAKSMLETLEKMIKAIRDVVAYFEELEHSSGPQREIALLALELRELYESIETIFFTNKDNRVYSVRLNRSKDQLKDTFLSQPLNVGQNLDESFYPETDTVIYTSATLSVDNSFDSFVNALGLASDPEKPTEVLQIESSYDFDTNMRVYLPTDMPEPQDSAYLPTLEQFLARLHLAQGGSMLTLFTNRKEMERCFDGVNPQIKAAGLRLVCQKWGVSVKGLRDDFLKDEHLSLFALKSFWEGFDAPGSTLKGVVIPKLPFGLPTDPLSCERELHDSRAWSHYSLPQAVISIKQAVGRLIRTSTDKGIVVLADKRLLTKSYGRKFLNSLPTKNIVSLTMDEIIEEIKAQQ